MAESVSSSHRARRDSHIAGSGSQKLNDMTDHAHVPVENRDEFENQQDELEELKVCDQILRDLKQA